LRPPPPSCSIVAAAPGARASEVAAGGGRGRRPGDKREKEGLVRVLIAERFSKSSPQEPALPALAGFYAEIKGSRSGRLRSAFERIVGIESPQAS
jgi:hypothetical protein